MSSEEQAPEDMVDTESAGGLGELIPEPLEPLWRPVAAFYEFRRTHSDTYIRILEALTALVLTVGYVWWLYLFVTG